MSQNQKPNQKPKEKIEAKPEPVIIVNQPMVRNFSSGGGHGPEDTLVEGDSKIGSGISGDASLRGRFPVL